MPTEHVNLMRSTLQTRSTKSQLVLLGVCFVLFLGATSCGDDAVDERVVALTDDTSVISPLSQLVGVAGSPSDSAADVERAAQESIADCMALAGFRYDPVPIPGGEALVSASGIPTREQVVASGYGIADGLEQRLSSEGDSLFVDPNEALRAGLSEEELAAYDAAISGVTPDEIVWTADGEPLDPDTGQPISREAFEAASTDGCLYKAYGSNLSDAAVDLLSSEAYLELQQRLVGDERMLSLLAGWSRCMSDQGYDYQVSQEAIADIVAEADHIMLGLDPDSADPQALAVEIDALRAEETRVATLDWDCSAGLFEQAPIVNRELEVEFILDNADRIVAILDEQANR